MPTIINDPKFRPYQSVIHPGRYVGDLPPTLPEYWWQQPRYETWTANTSDANNTTSNITITVTISGG